MNLLLDTHVFLWYINGDKKLKEHHRLAIETGENKIYLSVASIWECIIKNRIGKLILPGNPTLYLSEQRRTHGIESLALVEDVFENLEELPLLHKDPFDRIIIAQAIKHDLKLVTDDRLS